MHTLDIFTFRKALLTASIVSLGFITQPIPINAENLVEILPDETVDGSVQLTPGYIAGTVDIGGQNISRIDLSATSGEYLAKLYPTAEGPYKITVNVPQGSSLDYKISGITWMDNYQTRMFFQDKAVRVAEGGTSQLDYIIDSGYVTGQFLTDGCSITRSELWAVRNDQGGFSKATTKLGAANYFRFPVQPNSNIKVYGQVQLSTGKTVNLTEKYIDILPGQDGVINWNFTCVPGDLSAINQQIDYHMDVDYHYSYLYNQGAGSPYQIRQHQGSVLFDNLAPDTWRLYTTTYWNDRQNLITKNFTNIETFAGQTTDVIFDEYPGFFTGKLSLTGTHSIEDTSYAHIYAYGQNALFPSYQTTSRALADNLDGSYRLALPYGEYRQYVTAFAFFNPEQGVDYQNSYMYMYDYSKINETFFISSDQVIPDNDIGYETGAAIIKFSRADGGEFTSPYIIARSYSYNEDNTTKSFAYVHSRGYATADRVTMIGFPGTYEVEAWADVDGSLTTFGKVEVEIVSGVEKIIDIGGPVVDVTNPAAGAIFTEETILVTGTATDESGVAAITVNGMEVEFSSTNNPEDVNEVSFTVEIQLVEGENTIITTATDISANESTDNRTVSYEIPEPVQTQSGGLLDIKPGSCKNPFNVVSKGVLPVVLLGSSGLDINTIDPATITLQGVAPLRYDINDVAAPDVADNCETDHEDGYDDLVLKFDSKTMVDMISNVSHDALVTLSFSAFTYDGNEIVAEDHVTIIKKGKGKK
ncbi:hypothetical protein [Desulfopila sp. IMCC35008]|uniref:hypothetical protein n=1 Tax=Desulfopila sp. IMCC35008 TaxID=2653858 RepID=UPI0013D2D85F|nr:hypothetical protein [Desulfopila sp. IMCC35008]